MNRGIYAASAGMVACQNWLDLTTQDLANLNTNGYKRVGVSFAEAMERQVGSLGTLGVGPVERGRYTVFEMGSITPTGNDLDVAIDADRGLFAVETPQGVRYTRDGAFSLDLDRTLVTKAGHAVLDADGRPIQLPEGTKIRISETGQVSIDDQAVAELGVYDGDFQAIGMGLYASDDAAVVEQTKLKPQSIESSNANPIEAMVTMIRLQRQFETAQRSILTQDEATQRLIQSLNQ